MVELLIQWIAGALLSTHWVCLEQMHTGHWALDLERMTGGGESEAERG